MNLTNLLGFNSFAKFFQRTREASNDAELEQQQKTNSQGVSQEELDLPSTSEGFSTLISPDAGMTYIGIQFEQYFNNKRGRIGKYREMSLFPEISDAIDAICDEAIIHDTDGNIVSLQINEEMPEYVEEQIRDIWNYLVNDVFNFNEISWDLFRKWLVESELFCELILNDAGDDMIGIKLLPSFTLLPVYTQNQITSYLQVADQINPAAVRDIYAIEKSAQIVFDKDQISYINYGLYGENMIDIRGFLESAMRTYNQLRNLEDSLVVYRLVRAPERRVWNIAVGKMPKGKAEQYIKGLIQKYKKRIVYDPDTGAMNSSMNIQALTEDFWFAKNEAGEGTTVDTIGGGMNLGEIEDVNYFLKKLYKTLKLPSSRWQEPGTSMYTAGKSGEVQREEIKFSRFVERLRDRFKYLLLNPFITLLKLRGIDDRYINHKFYNVIFTESNLFKEYKEMELLETKFTLFNSIWPYIYRKEDNEVGFIAEEFAIRNYLMWSDEDMNWNKELLDQQKGEVLDKKVEGEEEFGAGEESFGAEVPAEETGGEVPEVPAELSAPTEEVPEVESPPIPASAPLAAPESFNFDNIKSSNLLKEWKSFDKEIKSKYRYKNKGIILNNPNNGKII